MCPSSVGPRFYREEARGGNPSLRDDTALAGAINKYANIRWYFGRRRQWRLAAGEAMLEDFLDAVDGIAYAVDSEHRIVAVGRRRWDRFAVENGVPELCADRVIGRDLFDFVSGPDVRLAYRQIADRVIATGEPAAVCARCDSPGVARQLRLSIAPLRFGHNRPGLLFQAQIIIAEERPRLNVFDFQTLLSALKRQSDLPIVTMCSFCQQLRRPGSSDEDDWVPVEEYYRLGGGSDVRISHGLCADCDAVRFPDL
jgi:hypothetical protein